MYNIEEANRKWREGADNGTGFFLDNSVGRSNALSSEWSYLYASYRCGDVVYIKHGNKRYVASGGARPYIVPCE
jgi:hypothetical protein